jgi:IS5 family transposase
MSSWLFIYSTPQVTAPSLGCLMLCALADQDCNLFFCKIRPETLEAIHKIIAVNLLKEGTITLEKIRIDSTVVRSNITPPSDSQLLNDSIRVLSRLLIKSKNQTRVKIRFTDKRKASKPLAFQIFNAKNAQK